MKNKIALMLLEKVQCMYQQKIISKKDKDEIARMIRAALKTGEYSMIKKKLKMTKCLISEKEYWIENTIKIIEGGN